MLYQRSEEGEGVWKKMVLIPLSDHLRQKRSGKWQQFSPQTLGFVNERSFIRLRQEFPVRAQPLRYLWVVHLGVLLCHLPPLTSGPDHEGVHRPLDVIHWLRPGTHRDLQWLFEVGSLTIDIFRSHVIWETSGGGWSCSVSLWLVSVRLTVRLTPGWWR